VQFIRIGDKLISQVKIQKIIGHIFELRAQGYSQKEVAEKLSLERSLISRLESLGQVRKGNRIALIGFPIANKEEVQSMAEEQGIDFTMVMNDEERWAFIREKDGITLFNELLHLLGELQEYDVLIFMGSDMRLGIVENIFEGEVIGFPLGTSPIKRDITVDIDELQKVVEQIKLRRDDS